MKLKENEFSSFPDDFGVTQKVFEYYYNIGFSETGCGYLNDAQKVLYYHFICDGKINNGGFYLILQSSKGEFNHGYLRALELVGDKVDRMIFEEITDIYKKYEEWFLNGKNPPVLDEESKEFDKKLYDRIEELEHKWYENDAVREALFQEYLSRHKRYIVSKE